jgi:hypothetical protein
MEYDNPDGTPIPLFHLSFFVYFFSALFQSSRYSFGRRFKRTNANYFVNLRKALSFYDYPSASVTESGEPVADLTARVYTGQADPDLVEAFNAVFEANSNQPQQLATTTTTTTTATTTATHGNAEMPAVDGLPQLPAPPFYNLLRDRLDQLSRDLDRELMPVLRLVSLKYTNLILSEPVNRAEPSQRVFHIMQSRTFRQVYRGLNAEDIDAANGAATCGVCYGNQPRVIGRCGHALCFGCYEEYVSRSNRILLMSSSDSALDGPVGSCYVCRGRFESLHIDGMCDTTATIQEVLFSGNNRTDRLLHLERQDGIRLIYLS